MSWSTERENLMKEAAANLREAFNILAAEKSASDVGSVEQVKQAMLVNTYRNLKYAELCDALAGAQ